MKKSYYITEMEFAVLLAAMGQTMLFGYSLQAIEQAEQDKVIKALFSLTKKGIVCPTEEGFKIIEEYVRLLDGIINAHKLYVTADREQKFPQLYVYEAEQLTVLQSSGQAGIMMKIEPVERSGFSELLMEYGFLHESSLQESTRYRKEKLEEKKERSEDFPKNISELVKQPEVRNILFVIDISGQEKVQQILIAEKDLNEEIIVENREKLVRYLYSPKKMIEVLEECIGGEK